MTDEDVVQLYQWYVEGMPVRHLARHFDITESYVYMLVKGRARKHLYDQYFPGRLVEGN